VLSSRRARAVFVDFRGGRGDAGEAEAHDEDELLSERGATPVDELAEDQRRALGALEHDAVGPWVLDNSVKES
jgi:hypothetical protein